MPIGDFKNLKRPFYLLRWSESSEPRPIYEIIYEVVEKLKTPFCSLFLEEQNDFFKLEKVCPEKNVFLWRKNQFFKNMSLGMILVANCNDIHEPKIFEN